MNARVIKEFRDKHTGERYPIGHVIKNISKERFEEILKKGKLVEELPEGTEEPTNEEVPEGTAKKQGKKVTTKTQ